MRYWPAAMILGVRRSSVQVAAAYRPDLPTSFRAMTPEALPCSARRSQAAGHQTLV
jgi:hypothetical protein